MTHFTVDIIVAISYNIIMISERFLHKFIEDPDTECWNWINATDKDGYGIYTVMPGKTVRAHRYSYQKQIGDIPEGMYICHKCDNPSCVNPNHLFLGSAQDNMDDKISKGRLVVGTGIRNRHAKLSEDDVLAIREAYAAGSSIQELADDYSVNKTTTGNIIRRITWKHI